MKLTARAIDQMTYEGPAPRADLRYDDLLPNFAVRVWPSGEKTFVIRYRTAGRRRYMTLGRYGVLTLDEARTLARTRLVEVLHGRDPVKEAKAAAVGTKTFAELRKDYLDRHAKERKKSWKDDERRLKIYVPKAWDTRPVGEITHQDVVRLHSDIGRKKRNGRKQTTTANRVVACLSKMFSCAEKWGYVAEGARNPCKGVEHFPEVKRDRFVRPDELPKLAAAIDAEPPPYRQLWWLYLHTGLRKSELARLEWNDVDLTRGELRLADTKAGRPHYLPLSTHALELFKSIPQLKENPYVFYGAREGQHVVELNDRWARVRKAGGVEDVWIHDLRRTLGSWMAQAGASLALIGRVLNHSNQSTTAIYARFHADPVRKALDEHGKLLTAKARPEDASGAALPSEHEPASLRPSS